MYNTDTLVYRMLSIIVYTKVVPFVYFKGIPLDFVLPLKNKDHIFMKHI